MGKEREDKMLDGRGKEGRGEGGYGETKKWMKEY